MFATSFKIWIQIFFKTLLILLPYVVNLPAIDDYYVRNVSHICVEEGFIPGEMLPLVNNLSFLNECETI